MFFSSLLSDSVQTVRHRSMECGTQLFEPDSSVLHLGSSSTRSSGGRFYQPLGVVSPLVLPLTNRRQGWHCRTWAKDNRWRRKGQDADLKVLSWGKQMQELVTTVRVFGKDYTVILSGFGGKWYAAGDCEGYPLKTPRAARSPEQARKNWERMAKARLDS